MIRKPYYGILFILLWCSDLTELFPFSPVTKLQITSDFSCQDSLREFVYSDMPSNQKNLEQGLSAQEIPVQQSVCGARRTKEYEQAAAQQLIFEQAYNNYIFNKSQEPRCALQLSDGSYLVLVLNRWKSALKNAHSSGDIELVTRLSKRVEVLSQTRVVPTRSFYNSDLESLLVCEFKDSYTSVKNIAQEYPQNIHAKMALSLLIECADLAFQELDIEAAFSHADFAHDLVTLVQRSIKGGVALARGAYHGAKTACSLEHWKQMAHGMLHLVKAVCKKGLELADVVTALESYNESHCDKVLSAFQERGAAEYAALQDHLKKSWHTIQKKSWDKLLESGAEMGTLMLLDTIMMNGTGYAATVAGRKFVSEVATVLKQGGAAREAYCAEVAGVGKLIIEDESATLAAFKELEKHPNLVIKSDVSMGEMLAEEIETLETNKIFNTVQAEKAAVNSNKTVLSEGFLKRQINTLEKKIIKIKEKSTISKRRTSAIIYEKIGTYKQALIDFYSLNPINIKPLLETEGFSANLCGGRTAVVRKAGVYDTRPTLDIHTPIGNKKLREKFRYGEK